MNTVVSIGIGSFIGGVFRYLLSTFIQGRLGSAFPYGTLLVNITGCFLIGTIYGLATSGAISQEWRLYLATGLIGGFTTFSAFSLELLQLLQAGRIMQALAYATISVVIGLLFTFIGLWLGRMC